MKKSYLFITTLLVVAAVAAVVVSCKKEKQEPTSNNTEQTVQSADNMDEYLISFKKKLLSAEKGGETISLEQAQRDLGNLLNFDFGDANYATNTLYRDTLHVPINLTDSLVDLSQLALTYSNAFSQLAEAYNKVDLPDKSVYSITCRFNREAKDTMSSDVELVLTIRGFLNSYLKLEFDTTDNWHVGELLGKCDGTCIGDDHVTMLEKVCNNIRSLNAYDCFNGRIYFSDFREDLLHATDFLENDPNINYNYHYRLWSGLGSDVLNYCIQYPEMRYYLNNFLHILECEVCPQGYIVTSILECFLDSFVSIDPNTIYSFACRYEIARINCTPIGSDY